MTHFHGKSTHFLPVPTAQDGWPTAPRGALLVAECGDLELPQRPTAPGATRKAGERWGKCHQWDGLFTHMYNKHIIYFFSFSSQWVQRPVLSCSIRLNVSPLAGNLAKRSWKSWLQNDMQHSPANACPALRAGPMIGEQPPRFASS